MTDRLRLVTSAEAAKLLKIHQESVRRLIRLGKLPAVKYGRQWFIDRDQLNVFSAAYNPRTGKTQRLL